INILKGLYSSTSARVWTNLGLSQTFGIKSGVKQGCGLSPLLFSFYANDLVDSLGGGVEINGKRISALLQDDLVLLAVHPSALQKMINRLEEYCGVWNLAINLRESKVVIFRKGRRIGDIELTYMKQNIEIVNEYNYLGVIFTPKLVFQINRKVTQAELV
ncbi:hypothetical protein AAG570_001348, partial [Ranatra chinensis]